MGEETTSVGPEDPAAPPQPQPAVSGIEDPEGQARQLRDLVDRPYAQDVLPDTRRGGGPPDPDPDP